MELEDALFEDMQALSDDAETLGQTDVALVLEFAMDVYLHETMGRNGRDKVLSAPATHSNTSDPFKPQFVLAQLYRHAS